MTPLRVKEAIDTFAPKPDWNAAGGSEAEILNKPTIPAAGQPVPTGAPSTWAVGTMAFLKANAVVNAGASVSGGSLSVIKGIETYDGVAPELHNHNIATHVTLPGTWLNISGGQVQSGNAANLGYFVRTA
jgi:hypothetical protein